MTRKPTRSGLAVIVAVGLLGLGVAFAGTAVAQTGQLTFDFQAIDDGEVTVENVSTAQNSTVVVTYTGDDGEIVAGIANADNLDSEDVSVEIQDTGGFPGLHTAWVFQDEDLPDDLGIGDNASGVADAALDFDSANIVEPEPTATVSISDQTSDGTQVTVDSVDLPRDGHIAIHSTPVVPDNGTAADSVIGVSEYLTNGSYEDVTVTLFDGVPGASFDRSSLEDGETVVAMPHEETNDNEEYDFVATGGAEDGPYTDNGSPVTDSAQISVEEPEQATVGLSNVTLTPDTVESNTTNDHTLTFDTTNISDDGNADTFSIEFPSGTLDSLNSASITNAVGAEVPIIGSDVSGDTITADIDAADGDTDLTDVTVEANVTVTAPDVDNEATANISIEIADSTTGQDSANATLTVTPEPDEPATGSLIFNDQVLAADGTVTVEEVTSPDDAIVVVTYTDGTEEVVAGVAAADSLDAEDVSVAIQDTGGFPGEHTAWLFENEDLPADLGIGDDATPVASAALDSESANVTETTQRPIEQYADSEGIIGPQGLGDAARDYRNGELDAQLLGDIAAAFRSGTPVA